MGPFGALFGMGVDNVLQFDVVTADGEQKVANACTNTDIFWALRGGGGAFAVTTRVYFKTYPAFAAVNTFTTSLKCQDDDAYNRMIETLVVQQPELRRQGQLVSFPPFLPFPSARTDRSRASGPPAKPTALSPSSPSNTSPTLPSNPPTSQPPSTNPCSPRPAAPAPTASPSSPAAPRGTTPTRSSSCPSSQPAAP